MRPTAILQLRGNHHVDRTANRRRDFVAFDLLIQRHQKTDSRLSLIVVEADGIVGEVGEVDRMVPTPEPVLSPDQGPSCIYGRSQRTTVTSYPVGFQERLSNSGRTRLAALRLYLRLQAAHPSVATSRACGPHQ